MGGEDLTRDNGSQGVSGLPPTGPVGYISVPLSQGVYVPYREVCRATSCLLPSLGFGSNSIIGTSNDVGGGSTTDFVDIYVDTVLHHTRVTGLRSLKSRVRLKTSCLPTGPT